MRSLASRRLALICLATCASVGLLTAAVAQGRFSDETPPPVPACYKQAGACEGIFLKSTGEPITKVTTSDKKGVFTLSGPAPLQFKTPVGCGDLGCIYNHLNWGVGSGAQVVKGCEPNTSTCSVKVPPGTTGWIPVLVAQNDYPVALFLVFNTGKVGYTLSGTILAASCNPTAHTCNSDRSPVSGVSVTAAGWGGGSATTDGKGKYSMTLPKGKYVVTPHDGNRGFDPDNETVNLTSDRGNVDFGTCATADPMLNTTLHRGTSAVSTSNTVTLKGANQKNNITIQVTPCGTKGATVAVTKWVAAPECQAPDGTQPFIAISPYSKDRFKAYQVVGTSASTGNVGTLGDRLPKKDGYMTDGNDRVTVTDHNGHTVMTITLRGGHRSATVKIDNSSPDLLTKVKNDITAEDKPMTCHPQNDTLNLAA